MATSAQKAEFYRVYGPIVEEQCRGTGLYPEVILAQLATESDYGQSPAAHGNLGGRKVSESQKANGVEGEDYEIKRAYEDFTTQEDADAFAKKQKDLGYRVYSVKEEEEGRFVVRVDQPFEMSGDGSPEDNVRGQIAFLQRNKRYTRYGVFDAESPEEQAKALKRAGYATDAGYAETLIEVYSQDDFPTFDTSEMTQEDYENYYEGAESVTLDGDNIVVDFGGGNVITEPKSTVDNNIRAQRNIEEEGGVVGAQDRATTGQQNPPVIPPVTGPGIEGDTQTVTNVSEDDGEPSGLSNEQATANDTEGAEYEVTYEEAQRVYGPTANIVNQNGVDRIVYTDSDGVVQTVETSTVTADTPDYTPPVNIPEAEEIEIGDQESVQDRTQTTPPIIVPETAPPTVEPIPSGPITTATTAGEDEADDTSASTETEEVVDTEQTESNVEETQTDTEESSDEAVVENITVPEGTQAGDVFTVDGKDYTVNDNGDVVLLGNAQIEEDNTQVVEQSSLTQEQVNEIYGPDARITVANGEERIIYPDADGNEVEITMSDAVARRDDEIASLEEEQQKRNADILGLKRRQLKVLKEDELNARLDATTLSDEEKEKIRSSWKSANEDNFLEILFKRSLKGDGSALKKAADLLKASGGVSSLVAGFIGAKAAKKGMETVDVPQIEGLSSAFKQYSMQQKALAETGLSYAERQTLQQGIDEAYEQGIQNLIRGTSGDRAKFLAGTGALDLNRQTSLLKVAALEDEARRQNREAYGKVLSFEANYNKDKDIFTKSREYNQKLADKAMFQNTASAAFDHVFDNIRFGQDYKPMLDAMEKLGNQIGERSKLLGSLQTPNNQNDTDTDPPIEAEDPNVPPA